MSCVLQGLIARSLCGSRASNDQEAHRHRVQVQLPQNTLSILGLDNVCAGLIARGMPSVHQVVHMYWHDCTECRDTLRLVPALEVHHLCLISRNHRKKRGVQGACCVKACSRVF